MKVNVYIDESGSIHYKAKATYFVIGGYVIGVGNDKRVKRAYRKENLKCRKQRLYYINKGMLIDQNPMDKQYELKAVKMMEKEKIQLFKSIINYEDLFFVVKIFDKKKMQVQVEHSNLFFNYGVQVLISDCILPLMKEESSIQCSLFVDSRSIKVQQLKTLQDYLNTYYCYSRQRLSFSVTYCDSKMNYGIQLADLIVNSYYLYHKEETMLKKLTSGKIDEIKKSIYFPTNRI